jgi:hypothetical protein
MMLESMRGAVPSRQAGVGWWHLDGQRAPATRRVNTRAAGSALPNPNLKCKASSEG